MHSLDSFLISFVKRIERAYLKKKGKELSDEEMIELLKICFSAGSCLIWYQMQILDGNALSDRDLLIYLCELQCSDDEILKMIEEGCLVRGIDEAIQLLDTGKKQYEDWKLKIEKRPKRLANTFGPINPW